MDDLARRVAIRYRQKGKARKQRVRQYRRNKLKSKQQNRHWRMKHKQHVDRYRRKRDLNPHLHELRRRSAAEGELLVDPAALLPIHFWDTREDVAGQVRSVAIDGTFIDTFVEGALRTYDIDDFLDTCIVIDEGAERTLFDVLDEIHGIDAEQEDEDELIDLDELDAVEEG